MYRLGSLFVGLGFVLLVLVFFSFFFVSCWKCGLLCLKMFLKIRKTFLEIQENISAEARNSDFGIFPLLQLPGKCFHDISVVFPIRFHVGNAERNLGGAMGRFW
jgi:hypothetical protein